jgi:hypothetical protein
MAAPQTGRYCARPPSPPQPSRPPPRTGRGQPQQQRQRQVGDPGKCEPARASWSTANTTAENVVKDPRSPGPRPARSQNAVCGRAIHTVVSNARTKLPPTLIPSVAHGTDPGKSGNASPSPYRSSVPIRPPTATAHQARAGGMPAGVIQLSPSRQPGWG